MGRTASTTATWNEALVLLRLLIADSDAETRAEVRQAAQARAIEIITEAGSGAEALRAVATDGPDAVVVGAHLADMRALECVAAIADAAPEVVIVMFGNVYGPTGQAAALTAGAHGYFARGIDSAADLISALADLPLDQWHRGAAGDG